MKKFCYNILIFFAIILLFNGFLFLFAECEYYKEYTNYPDKSFNNFLLSDSHGLPISNFSNRYNVFNFSAGSDSYFDMKRKLLFLINNKYNIDKIYITVDDHTLSPYREENNNLDRSSFFSSINEYENYYKYFQEKYINYYFPIFQSKINSLFKYYLKTKIKQIILQNNNTKITKSWNDLSENEKIKKALNRKKVQFPTNYKSKKLQITLLEIISICKKNNIKLIGIKFPISKSYIKVLNNKNYEADMIFISKGIEVINGKNIFVENPEYFANQDHMNKIGG